MLNPETLVGHDSHGREVRAKDLLDKLATLETTLARARETNTRLNRRVQKCEAAIAERLASPTDARGFGRMLANAAAEMYRAHAERLRDTLRESYDAMSTWFSSEYLDSPIARRAANVLASSPSLDHVLAHPLPDTIRATRNLLAFAKRKARKDGCYEGCGCGRIARIEAMERALAQEGRPWRRSTR